MVKTEICRKVTGLGDGKRTLVYYVIDEGEGIARFGVSVMVEESRKEAEIRRLSNDEERVKKLIDLLATDFITPNSLESVAYRWFATL